MGTWMELLYPYMFHCSLQNGQSHLTVKINQWTEVSTLMQLYSTEVEVRHSLCLCVGRWLFDTLWEFLKSLNLCLHFGMKHHWIIFTCSVSPGVLVVGGGGIVQ